MKKNITAALIGSGYMGKKHIEVLAELVDNIILCTTDEKAGLELKEQYNVKLYADYEEMFEKENIDFVDICLPTNLHHKAAMCAISHNVNILCEKPFASDVKQAEEIYKAAEEKGILLMVAHCKRFSKTYEYLKRCINDKRFGELVSLNLSCNSEKPSWSVGNWLADMKISGGVVVDFHIHDTDLMESYFGAPKEVLTTGNNYAISTIYNYSNGACITASSSWRNVKDFPFSYAFDAVFENAAVKMENEEAILYLDGLTKDPIKEESFSEFFESDNLYENEIKYYVYCLENKVNPDLCAPKNSVQTMLISKAEIQSLNSGNAVKVETV